MHDALIDFPLVIKLPVVWREMDSLGHVNNVIYFTYFENARIAYFEKVGMAAKTGENSKGPILGSTSCRFKVPLVYPDTIWVGARMHGLSEYRFHHKYVVVSEKLERVAATGEGTIVYYDYFSAKKSAIPADLRQRILDFDPLATAERDERV